MLPNSLKTREIRCALLFGPPRFLSREAASAVHGAVCDALGVDDLAFRYSSMDSQAAAASRGFKIEMDRKEGRGGFAIALDHAGGQAGDPIRLLMLYRWPPSMVHVSEVFDMASGAVFGTLEGRWQTVMAEVNLRAQCETAHRDGLRYVLDRCIKLPQAWVEGLGSPLAFASVGFEVNPAEVTQDPLDSPARNLKVEVLREDPSGLYIELVSRWTQLPLRPGAGPAIPVDVRMVRKFDQKPSAYVKNAQEFLIERIGALAEAGDG
ncbi:MAG: hypothetical protein C4547_09910 [Phycisphaerales bacterium]|nr:MAG: hypothetical protein C4547_09910 [Phycisphaerales bacterium]